MRFLLEVAGFLASYLVVVVGGVTLVLSASPLIGYRAYSDRPGPGWFEPAPSWEALWHHLSFAAGFGVLLAYVLVVPALVAVVFLRSAARLVGNGLARRTLAGTVGVLPAGYAMFGAGWYVAAGSVLVFVSAGLGGMAGAWLLGRRPRD